METFWFTWINSLRGWEDVEVDGRGEEERMFIKPDSPVTFGSMTVKDFIEGFITSLTLPSLLLLTFMSNVSSLFFSLRRVMVSKT